MYFVIRTSDSLSRRLNGIKSYIPSAAYVLRWKGLFI